MEQISVEIYLVFARNTMVRRVNHLIKKDIVYLL